MRSFRLLRWLYPAALRAKYGDEMAADFAARRRGARAVEQAGLWIEAIGDALVTGPRTHGDLLRQDLRASWRAPTQVSRPVAS
jgi:hypothetical protein